MGVGEAEEIITKIGFVFSVEQPQSHKKNPQTSNEPTRFNYICSLLFCKQNAFGLQGNKG